MIFAGISAKNFLPVRENLKKCGSAFPCTALNLPPESFTMITELQGTSRRLQLL